MLTPEKDQQKNLKILRVASEEEKAEREEMEKDYEDAIDRVSKIFKELNEIENYRLSLLRDALGSELRRLTDRSSGLLWKENLPKNVETGKYDAMESLVQSIVSSIDALTSIAYTK